MVTFFQNPFWLRGYSFKEDYLCYRHSQRAPRRLRKMQMSTRSWPDWDWN